jgi:hypothetical protein
VPTDYTPNPAPFHATITVPVGSDKPRGTLFSVPYMQLADNIAHVEQFVPGSRSRGYVSFPFMNGNPESLGQDVTWYQSLNFSDPTPILGLVQGDDTTSKWIFDVSSLLPWGTFVTGVRFTVHGAFNGASHAGGMPLHMPEFRLNVFDPDGTNTASYALSDPSTLDSEYDVSHVAELDVSGTPVPVDATKRYVITIVGEWGTDAIADSFAVTDVSVRWESPTT